MNEQRTRFNGWIDRLLDPSSTPDIQRAAAVAWCDWALAVLGVDEQRAALDVNDTFFTATALPAGKAISPLGAAQCVREQRRTAVFLQATEAAIREARRRFPGEPIHVVEVGCGPLAPLTLPFALRFAPDDVRFTLIDLHPASLAAAQRLAAELGVSASIRACLAGDATQIKFATDDRPHVMVCETLLRALTREPQVAVTLNLAPQLRPGGFFLPQKISVLAGLLDFAKHDRLLRGVDTAGSAVIELGQVFCLDAARLDALRRREDGRLAASAVRVPPHGPRTPLHLFTRIQVFGDHRLGDFDSSLNLPHPVRPPLAFVEQGGTAAFHYEISSNPGLRLDIA